MSLITDIKNKLTGHHSGCCCGHDAAPKEITKDMIVRDVTNRWPQTINVFGKHKVDFCCGGAHSIEQTARARGCQDIDALVADLNTAIQ
ncbi:MAG TPA: DUF542 domain-containing protein [Verrucomicrobiae bacterium]|nr:DUF542 domain-containing protein [Verrucomicrobiae bacterium]